MERLLSDLGRMYRERNVALQALESAHHEALIRLAVAAELRDDDTGAHILRLGYLAEALARLLGVPAERAQTLRLAAPMHDIGKIGIPDQVLKKPGQLTAEERALMQTHPRLGAEILGSSRIPLFALAAEVALHHHERWDGTGYPRGLAGEDIPLSGRIVAVVDYFDALTMDRCYRPAFADDRALAMLADLSGSAFDPAVVATFLAHASELIQLREWVNATQPGFGEMGLRPLPAQAHPLPRQSPQRSLLPRRSPCAISVAWSPPTAAPWCCWPAATPPSPCRPA
ncbi:HD domain-containing protein [Pelomonas aquatica]|uniref:HD domain-containing protein n=3 Tax=Pseudomonadota TaxID=1224 RepID=A0A9X4LNC0_9BURK|nr:HD domain-containing protein [Pelomonas aquatica]